MSCFETTTTGKLISVPMVVSSFVGIMMAVPFAYVLSGPISASASQAATSQVNVDDFAKFAYAFNQGYEASAVSTTSSDGGSVSCVDVSVPAKSEAGGASSTSQVNVAAAPMVGGRGGGAAASAAKLGRTASMINSFNSYTSMVNNSSTVSNVNSNNTVGSNNSTRTDIDVSKSKGVIIGVENDSKNVVVNANESMNKDSYNTSTETTIVNDSFKHETNNTTTTNVDVDVNKETNITKNDNSFNTDNSSDSSGSNNGSGNGSGNTSTVDIDAHLDVLSHNDVDVVIPEGGEV